MVPLTTHRRALLLLFAASFTLACSSEPAKHRLLDDGRRLLKENKYHEAAVAFQGAIALDEAWGEPRYMLAEALVAAGEPERAYREYVRAADLMPDDHGVQVKAARYLSLVGQHQDAKTRAEGVLRRDPKNIEAQIALGNAMAGLNDLEGAVKKIAEAVQLDPNRSATYTNLALVRVTQGQPAEAMRAFAKAVEMDPMSVPARLALANFQWSSGDATAAESSLKQALEIDPRHLLGNRVMATFLMAAGRAGEAERYLKTAADLANSVEATLTLADYYITYSRSAEARHILQPLDRESGDRGPIDLRLANLDYLEGRKPEAYRRIEALLRRERNNFPALMQRARWLLADGRTERGLEAAQSAVAASPRTLAAYYLRAEAEMRTGRTNDAIKSFNELLRLNPRATDAQIQLSRLHLAHNEIESAVLFAEEALASAPESLDARLALIRAWIARRDLKLAESDLLALRARFPVAADVHTVDGGLRLALGDALGAHAAFERALQIDPTAREALSGITGLDVVRGDIKTARARVDEQLRRSPDDSELLLLSAKIALAGNDLASAEQTLRRSIAVEPFGTTNFALLARLFAQQKRLDAAATEFEEMARQRPSEMSPRMMQAVILHTQGNVAKAQTIYEGILKGEPRAALAANNLASIFADKAENLDYAQQLAESAAQQLPANAAIRDTLGWIYYQRQMPGLALQQFLRSTTAEPTNADYQYHLGLAYAGNHEPERAADAFRRALKLNPRLSGAQKALSAIGPAS
jgi:tetratricopeptide (TPR) repeat protein